jgi:hypothetical protein
MRTFTNFFAKNSAFQVARVIPGGVSSLRPVNLFNRPTPDQIKGLASFYVPTDFKPASAHIAFSYKYFLAKWNRYEQKKSYSKFFGSSGTFPFVAKPFQFFEGFVPSRRKFKFFHKRINITLTFKNQPINGLKSFIKFKAPTQYFFSYFDTSNQDVFSALASSKKVKPTFPCYKFFKFRKHANKRRWTFSKRFFTGSHRFYVLNLVRNIPSKKKSFIRSKKYRRTYKFFRRFRKLYRNRRQWISGNFFEIFTDLAIPAGVVDIKKRFFRMRIARYFFRKKRFFRFKRFAGLVKRTSRIRRKVFRAVFCGSRKKVARLILQNQLLGQQVPGLQKTIARPPVKAVSDVCFTGKFTRYFKVFSLVYYLQGSGKNYSHNLLAIIKNFFIRFFKISRKFFYFSRNLPLKKLFVNRSVRQVFLFNFFSSFVFANFVKFKSGGFVCRPVTRNFVRLRSYQKRHFVRLYRFSSYFSLLSRLMIFPRDEPEYISLKLQFLQFLYSMTNTGKNFYMLPLLFNKNNYFGTCSLVNPDFYARATDEYACAAVKPLRPKVFKLLTTI